jgi:hypothetical protein
LVSSAARSPGALEHRTRGLAQVHAELVRDHVRERGLAEARRPEDQRVVERLAAPARRLDVDRELFAHRLLAQVLVELARTDRGVEGFVLRGGSGAGEAI